MLLTSVTRLLKLMSLLGLLVLLTAMPLADFIRLNYSYEFSKFAVFIFLAGFLLAVNSLLFLTGGVLPSKKTLLILFFFMLFYLVSAVFSISRATSFFGYYGFFTGGFIYMFLLINIFLTVYLHKGEKRNILLMIFLAGVLVSCYGIREYFEFFRSNHNLANRIVSTIGQPNRLAFYLLAVFPVGIYLTIDEKNKLLKLLFGVSCVIIALAFFLTFSRTSYLIFLLIFSGIIFFQLKTGKRPYLLFLPVAAGLILFGFIFARSIPSTISDYKNSSLSLRLAEWQGSFNAVVNRGLGRQLIGYGPETVYFTFFKFRPVTYNLRAEEQGVGPGQIRNYYLHLLSGIGLAGLGLYLYFVYYVLKKALAGANGDDLTRGIFFSFTGIALLSFFYYQTENVLLLFWVFAALVVDPQIYSGIKVKKLFFLPFLLIGLTLIYLGIRTARAEIYASAGGIENLKAAIKSNPVFDTYPRSLSKLYMNKLIPVKTDRKQAEGFYLLSRQAALQAYAINPVDIRNIRQLLLIQYYGGAFINKQYHYNNIELANDLTVLSPTDPNNWDLKGLVYLDLGLLDDAQAAFEKEKTLAPDSPGVYLHLGEVAKQQGKLDTALVLYNRALTISPGWDLAEKEIEKIKVLLPQK